MARNPLWQDDYWLLLLHAYLKKPLGVKVLYSRVMVNLSLELHIPPQALHARMMQLSRLEKPLLERIWKTYRYAPEKLARAVRLLRQMKGFGAAQEFFEGVEVQETFERDFRPLVAATTKPSQGLPPLEERLTPMMLIIIFSLYFQLTPSTMVPETPEVKQLANLMKLKAGEVAQVLDIFQHCDPYLNRDTIIVSPLLLPCQQVWQRFGHLTPTEIEAYATQLKDYFTT